MYTSGRSVAAALKQRWAMGEFDARSVPVSVKIFFFNFSAVYFPPRPCSKTRLIAFHLCPAEAADPSEICGYSGFAGAYWLVDRFEGGGQIDCAFSLPAVVSRLAQTCSLCRLPLL